MNFTLVSIVLVLLLPVSASCDTTCGTCSGSTCQSCSDANSYLSGAGCQCNSNYYAYVQSPYLVCYSTSYTECNFRCVTCNSWVGCLTCVTNASVGQSGWCYCGIGYYEVQSSQLACYPCDSSCLTCTGPTASNCATCPLVTQVINQGVCQNPPCPSGTYADSTMVCQTCDVSCATCTAATSYGCSSCAVTFSFVGTRCVQDTCPIGTFANTALGACSSCPSNCDVCSSTTSCTTCTATFSIANGSCSCGSGFQLVGTACADTCGDGKNYGTYTGSCDDGNTVSGDGCSSTCHVEPGWVCVGDFPSRCYRNVTATGEPTGSLTVTPEDNLIFTVSQTLMNNITLAEVSIQITGVDFSSALISFNNTYYVFNLTFHQSIDAGTGVTFTLTNPSNVVNLAFEQISLSVFQGNLSRKEVWQDADIQYIHTMLYVYHGLMAAFGAVACLLGLQHFFWEFWSAITFFSFAGMMNVEPPSLMADFLWYLIPCGWIRDYISGSVTNQGQGTSSSIAAYGLTSALFAINSGHILLILAIFLLLYGLNLMGKVCKEGSMRNLSQRFGSLFTYSIPIRMMLLFYFELAVYVYVQLKTPSSQTYFIIFSYVLASVFALFLGFAAFWLVNFILKNWQQMKTRQEDALFFRKFRVLFFELKEESSLHIYSYQILQVGRKLAYLFTFVALDSLPVAQIIVNAGHSIGFLVWVLLVRPFEMPYQAVYTAILELTPVTAYVLVGILLIQTTVAERLTLTKMTPYLVLALTILALLFTVVFHFVKTAKFRKKFEPTPIPAPAKAPTKTIYDDDYEYWANQDRPTADRKTEGEREIDSNRVVFFKRSKEEGVTWLPAKFKQAVLATNTQ